MKGLARLIAQKVVNPCRTCKCEMDYICVIAPGDEEGRGSRYLYQCPKCKTVDVR